MKLFTGLGDVPADFGPSVVTIGKFDGVHAGHRAVIADLLAIADAESLTSTVVTFDRHPLAFLAPEKCPEQLVSTPQKIELLATTGVDAALVLRFDETLSSIPAEAFVRDILVGRLRAQVVFVGADFRFGSRGAGDVGLLERMGPVLGFEVRVIDDVRPEDGRRVSSTWIRELLEAGDVASAARLLGHTPTVRGVVVHGAARGRELGFPTANLSPSSEGLIPADGVYAGWLVDGDERYPAAVSVGNNPTFEGVPQKQVEAYVLDREIDLYGHEVAIEFVTRIRGMVAFEGIDALIRQMSADVDTVRSLLT
ncbi:bifunctional riboflavin kinase/FAD synthetase [Agromyces atrinae]|uniref:Riboflavin biosynthesis protein n=1 Tax=Agromyces atrinae TaxID=592376 RepID=A0A4Q2M2V7_9MICO|nr:bifunctional riboflavin kinase/FAD synthetase [Agromyces atrinae]NYD65786.1 riboflavin kinase/FMN adenylyltransferase [Agromyces atrinae]RXZ86139.1 bifunctional riboflavin kinase/FAD synthetase [Agromyces atrinae]